MSDRAGLKKIRQRMVEATENHTTSCEGLNRRQTKPFGEPAGAPIICRIIQYHRRLIE